MARKVLKGIPVSAGVSVGRALFVNRSRFAQIPREAIPDDLKKFENARLELAFQRVREELSAARGKVPKELQEHAAIIDTHLMISQDPKLLRSAQKIVNEMGITAEWGLEKAVDQIAQAFAAIDDAYIRERIQDVRLVSRRIMDKLLGQPHAQVDPSARLDTNARFVMMAHDLTPADTIGLDISKIMSLATVQGGKTSHTGILARSLQIPALVGVEGLEEEVADGDLVILDGLKGSILVDPNEDELAYYSDLKYQFENYQSSITRECGLPAETIDGYRVNVFANIEIFEEVAAVLDVGGEGVGLYRTEYSFMDRATIPDEEAMATEYSELAALLAPRRVTFRTLDLGADKLARQFGKLDEPNPALGLRAVRFTLKHPELFRQQVRAICRASHHGNVAIMFPLISGVNEIDQCKAVVRDVQQELAGLGIPFDPDMPIGIMVELPCAVFIADVLAREVDFFSIGTNDLIQYSLGIDRINKHVSYLYQPLHPAIVRSIKYVVDSGHQAGIEVSVCGELASDPYCVPILLGMQVDNISITPHAIPGIKRVIRQTTMQDCKNLLHDVLQARTVAETNQLVRDSVFKRFPEELMFFSSLLD
ncbi:phosphoenolpyruvate--protein phosphotransferase [Megalodesulfovibrio paquesii]